LKQAMQTITILNQNMTNGTYNDN